MTQAPGQPYERLVGRYALYGEIASGGMATVHFGRLIGPVGFSRTVAIKRLHAQFAKDPEFVAMFLDEARLAGRIQHPNVVATLDVVALEGELFLVMEYVQGESLAKLLGAMHRQGSQIPPRIVTSILAGALYGLHAAHEATDERGQPLHIVHRDVSPQNVLVGADGTSRVLDFGVAKAVGRMQSTREGEIKGKLAYMSPEQIKAGGVDRRTDVYGAAVVLWETLTARRLFDGEHAGIIFSMVMNGEIEPPSRVVPGIPPELDDVVLRGLARDPDKRYPTARAMAMDLEDRVGVASPRQVSEWLAQVAGDALSKRAMRVQEIESLSTPAPALMLESIGAAGALHAHGLGSPPASAPPSPPAPNLTGTFGPLPSARAPQPPAGWQPDVAPSSGLSSRSQVSSVSVATSAMLSPAPSTGHGRLIAVAGGAAAAVGVAAVIVLLFGGEPSAGSAAPQTAPTGTQGVIAPEPTAAAAATADPIVPAVAPAPSASSAAPSSTHESGPAPGAPDASTSSPSVASPAGQPSGPPPVKPVATGKPRAADCFPPYTIDAKGIRRPKPQCL